MKLFGLENDAEYDAVLAREDLFKQLSQYGPEISAGIGIRPGAELNYFPTPRPYAKVLTDLVEFFQKRGNRIHFLETKEHLSAATPLVKKLEFLTTTLGKTEGNRNNTLMEQFALEIDKMQIELNHHMLLGKFDVILENVISKQPDLVFLQVPYAKKLWSKRQLHGVNINEFYLDTVLGNTVGLRKQDLQSCIFDEDAGFFRINRLFRAAKEDCVTYGSPAFTGTWDFDFPHRGLFEMYIQNSSKKEGGIEIEGRIEDCLGTAGFKGKLEPKGIVFVKRYQKDVKYPDGIFVATSPITYSGFAKGDELMGTYQGKYCGMGNFRMKEVSSEWRKFTR